MRYHLTSLKGAGGRDSLTLSGQGKWCGGEELVDTLLCFFCVNSFFVIYLLLLILLLLLLFSYLIVLSSKLFLSRSVISAFSLPPDEGGKGSTIWLGRLSVEGEATDLGSAVPNSRHLCFQEWY